MTSRCCIATTNVPPNTSPPSPVPGGFNSKRVAPSGATPNTKVLYAKPVCPPYDERCTEGVPPDSTDLVISSARPLESTTNNSRLDPSRATPITSSPAWTRASKGNGVGCGLGRLGLTHATFATAKHAAASNLRRSLGSMT